MKSIHKKLQYKRSSREMNEMERHTKKAELEGVTFLLSTKKLYEIIAAGRKEIFSQ